jgi:hypothetical protein
MKIFHKFLLLLPVWKNGEKKLHHSALEQGLFSIMYYRDF